jgi:D-aminopeptidase
MILGNYYMINTKYFNRNKKSHLIDKVTCKYKCDFYKKELIIVYENNNIYGFLEFINDEITLIKVDKPEYAYYLISKYLIIKRYIFEEIKINKKIFSSFKNQFTKINYPYKEENDFIILKNNAKDINRLVKVGILDTGKNNSITDVPGVKVGHTTYHDSIHHTGITAIIPHADNVFKNKLLASCYVGNGFSKPVGFIQVEELGTIETPILFTNTLSIGVVTNGLIKYMIENNEDIGLSTGTVNPIVMECNDSSINNIRDIFLNDEDVNKAIKNAESYFLQGSYGAGSGMCCHGFKGGIGSSSRIVKIEDSNYNIGVIVNSNFKGNSNDLVFNKKFVGNIINDLQEEVQDRGSIAVVIATDIPLDNRQLKRLCKRAIIGIGNTGSYMGNGSGDVVLAFSTANIIRHYSKEAFNNINTLQDEYIDTVFRGVVEAVEEAVLNSLLFNFSVKSYKGKIKDSINEYLEAIDDLLITNL